jgi:signal transduction histidine kinase
VRTVVVEEVALFLRQLGGGPGADPANSVPRFVIPAIFWGALAIVAVRRWRAERAERDGLLVLAAALGCARELFMLAAEYGSARGLFDFDRILPFYPPFEHALELVIEMVAGYAFVAAFRGKGAVVRAYLWTGLAAVAILYAVTAPAWAAFARSALPVVGPNPEFAQHPGDLAFRIVGVAAILPVVAALLFKRGAGAAPILAGTAFLAFLLDHALMIANVATGLRHASILAPLRHNLHMWAVPALLTIYWWELVEALRRGELQRFRGQKLESLGLMAGGVAHDFSNLLAVVRGNLGHALGVLPPGAARDAILDAQEGAQRALELTSQLLAYAGRGETRAELVRLDRLAEETARLVRSSLPPGCLLDSHWPDELPLVFADATQLRQVLMNLMLNAGQSMKGTAGALSLRAGIHDHAGEHLPHAVFPDRLPAGRYAWIEVEDQGKGMDEAMRARIFDPFFTTRPEGRGLGLPVVLGIVRGHRGALDVRSEPGVGTTFRVYLPVAEADADARAPSRPEMEPASAQ